MASDTLENMLTSLTTAGIPEKPRRECVTSYSLISLASKDPSVSRALGCWRRTLRNEAILLIQLLPIFER